MPSFDSVDMGPFVSMQTSAAPPQLQVNESPGVDGLEVLYQGSRGGTTTAHGACFADDLPGLAATEQQFRTLQVSGIVSDLVDTEGSTWPNVMLVQFRPVGEILFVPGYGWAREYDME